MRETESKPHTKKGVPVEPHTSGKMYLTQSGGIVDPGKLQTVSRLDSALYGRVLEGYSSLGFCGRRMKETNTCEAPGNALN